MAPGFASLDQRYEEADGERKCGASSWYSCRYMVKGWCPGESYDYSRMRQASRKGGVAPRIRSTQLVTVLSVGTLEQESHATHQEHWTPVLSGVPTIREDNLASSHGRSGFSWPQVLNILTHQRRHLTSTWAACVGMPRRYVDVASPCDEVQPPRHRPKNWRTPAPGYAWFRNQPVKPTQLKTVNPAF